MTTTTIEQRIEAAAEKLRQLKAKKNQREAKTRARLSAQRRTDETRRRILLGAYLLTKHGEEEIAVMMAGYLTEDRDRKLFGLAPLEGS